MPEKITGVSGASQIDKADDKMSGTLLKRSDGKPDVPSAIKEISGPFKVTKMTQEDILKDLNNINKAVTVDTKSGTFKQFFQSIQRVFQKIFPGVDITALDKAATIKLETGSITVGGEVVAKRLGKSYEKRDTIVAASMKGLEKPSVPNTFAVAESLKEEGTIFSEALKTGKVSGKIVDSTKLSKDLSTIVDHPEIRTKVIARCEADHALPYFKTFEGIYTAFKESPPNLSLLVDTYDKYISDPHTGIELHIQLLHEPDIKEVYKDFIADDTNPQKAKAFMEQMFKIAGDVSLDLTGNQILPMIRKDYDFADSLKKNS